ncbi:RING-9 protein [Decorospora gaudefroyi]|uniref:RING-type E3 ubiquitin transferase n=1 Tax=Decorospora gaudefroyi TaxID=184978 RepID=A0A6A5K8I8_9PLEO|nr:RING-9 protein [Decorospora gaudefroyi]
MRPLRLLLSLSTSLLAATLLFYVVLGTSKGEEQERISVASNQDSFKTRFSFASPGSLFPPSAIISLTDDNSTFFLARPAAFGPTLPNHGLSGPLWIGSGFGDDIMATGGELGCSDVPGWDDGNRGSVGIAHPPTNTKAKSQRTASGKDMSPKEGISGADTVTRLKPALDDGTDDHLQPSILKPYSIPSTKHADIQSIQESAEIAGKVVLLKRGGCGFLAKVQWAQSRGGIAVIVGDDVRGGALVRMYAKGDTSNITIPSLFTSHTTAHLLSSLLPAGGVLSEPKQDIKTASHRGIQSGEQEQAGKIQGSRNRPTPTQGAPKALQTPTQGKHDSSASGKDPASDEDQGWLHSLLSMMGFGRDNISPRAGSRRLPSSGDLEWVQVGDWDDDQKPIRTKSAIPTSTSTQVSDGFVIGEQDWRDPDLLPLPSSTGRAPNAASATPVNRNAAKNTLPGSGEYIKGMSGEDRTWWRKWSSPNNDKSNPLSPKHTRERSVISITGAGSGKMETSAHDLGSHEGLWVTLTPTNVSSSPFFDTLLVLVVSPLVTLTVVYALLLLRSRIRRRRWRAPKSVVERLPVRTYQTISDASSAATPSAASPTTPLLQHSPAQPRSPVSRSRSTTESEVPATSTSVQHGSRDREEEKRESGLAAWRRRYGGRQRECVVCLEEYVDGVSQVMSLPCGHEFHAECITPWLVTRRRTCPICKGDVVRSLSQSWHDRLQPASPTSSPRLSIDGDDIQRQAAETRNESPSASRPVPMPRSASAGPSPPDDDMEAGWPGHQSRRNSRDISESREGTETGSSLRELASSVSTVVWRGFDAVRNTTGLQRRPPTEDPDRNR